jgi:hypothetical protein
VVELLGRKSLSGRICPGIELEISPRGCMGIGDYIGLFVAFMKAFPRTFPNDSFV